MIIISLRFPFRHSVPFECVYLQFGDVLEYYFDPELWVDARLVAWFFRREGSFTRIASWCPDEHN